MPLSSQRLVDANEFAQLLERLRISVPSSIMESERTLAERDRILADAETEAKRMLAQAKQRAAEMVSSESLVVLARREAEKIVEDGRIAARRRTEEADAYATQVLEDLAAKLAVISKQVDNGLQMMRSRRAADRQSAAPPVPPVYTPPPGSPAPATAPAPAIPAAKADNPDKLKGGKAIREEAGDKAGKDGEQAGDEAAQPAP